MQLLRKLPRLAIVIVLTMPASSTRCAHLAKISISGVSVTSASDVAAGYFTPPGSEKALDTPAFCRVVAVARPTQDSVINFEVWIPSTDLWNHEFLGVGNGGYDGIIQYARLADALKRGFAAASTDTGHTGADLTFAAGHPEKIVDWGYRAIHVMTESAKLIIRGYSGALPKHSFFMGCSTGGHQALSEVQRFPTDYDGVVAGDPGNNECTSMLDFYGYSPPLTMRTVTPFFLLPNSPSSTKQRLRLATVRTASQMESSPTRRDVISTQPFSSAKPKKMTSA